MKQITFNLKEEDFQMIEEAAKKERRSKASFIRNIVFDNIMKEKRKEEVN